MTPEQIPQADDAPDGEAQPAAAGMAPGLPLAASGVPSADMFAISPPSPAVRAETGRLYRLALAAAAEKDYPAAVPLLRRVLALNPNSSAAHYNLGVVLGLVKHPAEAETHYRQAIAMSANCIPAYMNLAETLCERNQFGEALACYGKVIALEPENVAAHNNAGLILRRTGRFAAAAAALARAAALAPADPRTRFNHAIMRDTAASRAEALECCRQCLEQNPGSAALLTNLAVCHQMVGDCDEALAVFERAITLDPTCHEAWFNRSLLRLALGDFAAGWVEYEHRWNLPQLAKPDFSQPLWTGEGLDGKTILLYSEQGFGDAIQFLRYVPQVAARGGRIVLRVERPLVRLAASLPGDMMVVSPRHHPPEFDVWCPLLSLPRILQTRLETIPGTVPYLGMRPALVERWRQHLAGLSGWRVGLAWAGDPRHINDFRRSMGLQRLMPLFAIPGISWISLQAGPRAADLAGIGPATVLDVSAQLGDFAETAGLIANLDLVITIDTVIAHLAGAIAKPVWTFVPFSPDWRWMLKREDSPWYPTMRLFRQRAPGDWDSVVARAADCLARLVANPASVEPDRSPTPTI